MRRRPYPIIPAARTPPCTCHRYHERAGLRAVYHERHKQIGHRAALIYNLLTEPSQLWRIPELEPLATGCCIRLDTVLGAYDLT